MELMDEVFGGFLGEGEVEGCYLGNDRGVKVGFLFCFYVFILM